jgi:hypothetical protein
MDRAKDEWAEQVLAALRAYFEEEPPPDWLKHG